jgi:hypothetical protein
MAKQVVRPKLISPNAANHLKQKIFSTWKPGNKAKPVYKGD